MIVLNTEMSDEYTNILTNVVLPFDPRRTKLLLGTLEYIAAEVIVAKVVRKIMRADNKGWLQLAYVHALSMPFLGGAAGFFDPQEQYTGNDSKGKKIGFATQLWDGAKGIPAVILAQYIVESFAKGFHAPWFNFKDLLITAGSKALTRPLVGFIYTYLPNDAANNLTVVDIMIGRQRNSSTLKSDK
jgi:hypothetical protein